MMERRASTTPTVLLQEADDSGQHRPGFVGRRRHTRRVRQVGDWLPGRSRKQMLKTVALCAGVLVLMAIGLYFGLSRQDTQQLPGAARFGIVGLSGIA